MSSISVAQPVHFGEARQPTVSGEGDLWAELIVTSDGTSTPAQPAGTLIAKQFIDFSPASLQPGPFTFGPTSVWQSGGGQATAKLFVWRADGRQKVLAKTTFAVLP